MSHEIGSYLTNATPEERAAIKARADVTRAMSPLEKARAHPTSRQYAINAKCWDCCNGDAADSPRWLIGNCEITDCALWPFRPHQGQYGKPAPAVHRDA